MTDLQTGKDPFSGVLVVPDGKMGSYHYKDAQPLTESALEEIAVRFERERRNLEIFYATVMEGTLLNRALELTSEESFMGHVLGRAAQEAKFANLLTKILKGEDTTHHSVAAHLPWISIYADLFTSTPIPENLKAVERAQRSVKALAALVTDHREMFDGVMESVRVLRHTGQGNLSLPGISELEFRVIANDTIVEPQHVTAESSVVVVDGRTFYNGLPADRGRFPTLPVGEGSAISVSVKNTSKDKLYAVVPTVNGLPFRINRLNLYLGGFAQSPFPVTHVSPAVTYVKPGETVTIDKFHVDRMELVSRPGDAYGGSLNDAHVTQLAYALARIFDGNARERIQYLLAECDPHLRERILHESRAVGVYHFLDALNKARETAVYVRKPVVADETASSALSNPMLGTLGFTVVEVRPVPREPVRSTRHEVMTFDAIRGSGMRSLGVGGLATVGGGADRTVERANFWLDQFRYDSMTHRFVGYAPVNLMSLR